MIPFPDISPEIVRIGPFAVRWYGMMYLAGFGASYLLVKKQIKQKGLKIEGDTLSSLYSYLILGLVVGGRLGYVIFYDLLSYIKNPLEIFAVWHGGMSFHGGLIGSIIAGDLFCKKYRLDFWLFADMIFVTAPVGLGFGRLGNFINGELYGRITDMPWGMIFPGGGALPRHPSQLYEMFFEGIILFAILWTQKNRNFRSGSLVAFFLFLYGLFRFFIEFFREPDAQIGFILRYFTMGQVLCGIMMFTGLIIFRFRNKQELKKI